jgi:hypothetical protein
VNGPRVVLVRTATQRTVRSSGPAPAPAAREARSVRLRVHDTSAGRAGDRPVGSVPVITTHPRDVGCFPTYAVVPV